MSDVIELKVYGTPGPQGSKRFVGVSKRGKGLMVESSAKVKPWREAVKWAYVEAMSRPGYQSDALPIHGPVAAEMVFTLPKPKSAPKTRRTLPDRKPDLDKLIRSTGDALTDAGAWEDDGRVVSITAAKRYPNEGADALPIPGAVIRIRKAA